MDASQRKANGAIAVDLDNTLADTSSVVVEEIRKRYNPEATIEGWTQYGAEKSFGIPRAATIELFHEAWKSWEKIPPVDSSAPDVLCRIHESAEIYIVTATAGRKEDFTRWLDNNGIPYDGIILVGHSAEKISAGNAHGIRAYIDDYEVVARSVAAEGRLAILFERPWNLDFAKSNPDQNIIPARSWTEIGSILDSLYARASNQ